MKIFKSDGRMYKKMYVNVCKRIHSCFECCFKEQRQNMLVGKVPTIIQSYTWKCVVWSLVHFFDLRKGGLGSK